MYTGKVYTHCCLDFWTTAPSSIVSEQVQLKYSSATKHTYVAYALHMHLLYTQM
jgi:hypothetical protein